MADIAFDLEYDGPALTEHEMDVRDLAPALISTADLFQSLNRTLYPVQPDLMVNVRATSEGSFLVQLKLIYDTARDTLAGNDIGAGLALTAIVGTVGTLVTLIRRRFRTPVVSEEPIADQPGLVRVTFADDTTMEVPADVLKAGRSIEVQRSLAAVVRPVEREGIDSVRFLRESIVIAEVPKADVYAFDAPPAEPHREVIFRGERETFLTIHTAGFQTNNWRFSDGQALVWAAIRDAGFIAELDSGARRVGKLDVLRCKIREEKWRDPTGFHSEVEVLDVVSVLPYEPGVQGTFDLPAGPE